MEHLTTNNIDAGKLLAVVEQATTPCQQVHVCSLYDYAEKLGAKTFASPSLIIIGKVVALHGQFGWLPNSNTSEEYFNPVEGKLINYKKKAERA